MKRYALLKTLVPVMRDSLVVCNIGIPSQELFAIEDRDNHFYMLGSMGLCTSIALGLSLNTAKKVIALEGDGSMLMNLSTLATIGNRGPNNLFAVIIDNGSYGATGDQASYTSAATSLAGIARAAGCKRVIECNGDAAAEHLEGALNEGQSTLIIAKVESGNEPVPVVSLHPVVLRERFRACVSH